MYSRSVSLFSGEELSSADSIHTQPRPSTHARPRHVDAALEEAPQEGFAESPDDLARAPPLVSYGTSRQRLPVCASPTASSKDWVRLNVGGRVFMTTFTTLCADPNTLLAQICVPLRARLSAADTTGAEAERSVATERSTVGSSAVASGPRKPPARHGEAGKPDDERGGGGEQLNPYPAEELIPLDLDDHHHILLDLDPDYFAPVLNYLRHRVVMIPPQLSPQGLLAVAEYLNVRGMVRQLRPERRVPRQLLFSWGSGGNGELGTQRFDDSDVPIAVRVAPFGVRITHVALGANYSCALSDDGNVYTFGNGDWGQLGLGGSKNLETHPCDKSAVVLVPRRIPFFERHRAVHICAGYAFAIAVVEDYRVYFWGNNNHGQSGLGPQYFDVNFKKIDEPKLVESLEGKRVVQVGCGSFFTIALTAEGRLYSWGLIECLGLGAPEAVKHRYQGTPILGESLSNEKRGVLLTPQEVCVETAHPIVRIHAGQWHSGAINHAGELFTWGVGYQGRLGHGTREPAYVPTLVRGALEGHRIADVACGSFHTVALTDRGVVFCWGDNASGQCGTSAGNMEAVTSPYRVVGLEYVAGGVARSISCGRQHTLVVMENPQPGCTQRCCHLDYHGKQRPSHAQVYTFGETPRSGGSATSVAASPGNVSFPFRAPSVPTVTPAGAGISLRTAMRTHSGANSGSGRGHVGPADNSVMLDYNIAPAAGSAISANLPPHRTCSQYRLVPGLERMDVRGIISGLYHTFVYAEELDVSDEAAFMKEE